MPVPPRLGARLRLLLDSVEGVAPAWAARRLDLVGSPGRGRYSMYGEDAVVLGLVERARFESRGRLGRDPAALSYIDVGAWRPARGSNTMALYRSGARGTLVEPNPHLVRLLRRARPADVVLAVACASDPWVDLQMFGPWAESNTASPEFAAAIAASQGVTVDRTVRVPGMTLSAIMADHVDRHGAVFLLSVDIEGMDVDALSSVDWSGPARPSIVIAEVGASTPDVRAPDDVTELMLRHGYAVLAQCAVSRLFIDGESPWNARFGAPLSC